MKKLFLSITLLLGLVAFAHANNLDTAVQWMNTNGLTIYNNATDFKADRGLRRDEAAKFFVQFATLLGKTGYVKTAAQCTFSDINQSRSDLKGIVVESCRLGLFQGSKGKFMPTTQLTNAQAIAVLVRLLAGMQSEVGLPHRSDNYYNKAVGLSILNDASMNSKNTIATRGNVGIIIYRGNTIANRERYRKIYSNDYSLYTINSRTYNICLAGDTGICINLYQYPGNFNDFYNTYMQRRYPDADLPLSFANRADGSPEVIGKKERQCFGSYAEMGFCYNENLYGTLVMVIHDQMGVGFNGGGYDPKDILKVIDFTTSCSKEGETFLKNGNNSCCSGLSGILMPISGSVGTETLCYNPQKGTPVCEMDGIASSSWYYPNSGDFLINDDGCYKLSPTYSCANEGERTNGSRDCCADLQLFDWRNISFTKEAYGGAGGFCYSPKKGTPVCVMDGVQASSRYYPNSGALLINDNQCYTFFK